MESENTIVVKRNKSSKTKTRPSIQEVWRVIKKNKISYLFIAPYIILFTIFTIIPVISSMVLSLTYFNILEPPKFIGFQNYIRIFFGDDVFLIAVKNTLLFAVITGPLSYLISFVVAWIINELTPKVRAVIVLIFYAPSISGNAYMIFNLLFMGDSYGIINGTLMKFGLISEPVQWLQNSATVFNIVIIAALWVSLGTSFLAFVAGLQGVDRSLYEAGAVDGVKNRWQELWFITLPSMKPQLLFGAVISITNSFAVSDIATSLAGFPSVDYAAHTIVQHLYDYGSIRYEMGYASAIATILFIMMITCNKAVHKLLRNIG
jgi:multiple sugar transport system permease protein